MSKVITEDGMIVDEGCEDCVVFFKTPYNHNTDVEAYRTATQTPTTEKSMTDQSFKEDADINTIMERIKQGHEYPIALPEHFGADERVDLFTARSRIAESNRTFYNLPAEIRSEFLNDPAIWERQVARDLNTGDFENLRRMGIDIPDPPEVDQGATPAPGPQGAAGAALAAPATPQTAPPGPKTGNA